MTQLESHRLADVFPLTEGDDQTALTADIGAHGLRERIVLHEGKILDGRNRYRALVALGQTGEENFRTFSEAEDGTPLAYVLSKNLHRRHLDESQRAMVAARIATLAHGQRQSGQLAGVATQAEAAATLNVGERSVRRARDVLDKAELEIVKAVDGGRLAVSEAAKAAKLDPETQRTIAKQAEAGHANVVRKVIKQNTRDTREQDLAAKLSALPARKFGVILADPEWRFEPWSRETGMDRSADNHYPTSVLDAIVARPVETIAADDAVLLLWATVPMMPQAVLVLGAWGFNYVTHIVWNKPRIGTGYWVRNKHELLLIGTRGKIPAPAPGTQFTR